LRIELEPQTEKRLKYLDFIDIYADLNDSERVIYQQRYPKEADEMTGFAERFIQQGEAKVLIRLMTRRFGELPDATLREIESADADTLLQWSERVLTAQTLDEVLH
jgi:hypothetical protein